MDTEMSKRDEGDFFIDSQLERIFAPVREMTDELLRESLKEHGCKQPLEVWDEEDILIDGHRRYAACKELGIPFEVRRLSFDSRDDVITYMRQEQFARRNCSDHERAIETAKLYESMSEGGDQWCSQMVADITGQSVRSVYRKVNYKKSYDRLIDEWRTWFDSGCRVPLKYVPAIASLDEKEQVDLYYACNERDYKAVMEKFPEIVGVSISVRNASAVKAPRPFRTLKDEEAAASDNSKKLERCFLEYDQIEARLKTLVGKVFGPQGIDAREGFYKTRVDRAINEIRLVMKEVKDSCL